MAKQRADKLVLAAGLADSREKARALILAGRVSAGGRRVDKAGELLDDGAALVVSGDPAPYASRGGVKLAAALDAFGISPAGLRCLDVGASTGGFTDCLLQRGAAQVTCVDVGTGQLDWKLRQDPRVLVIDGVNARWLEAEALPGPVDLVTADVSFISLTKVLPALVSCAPGATFVVLVKPQFEVGRGRVGRGGVVRDPALWRESVGAVAACLRERGLAVAGAAASPISGPAGNRELFVHAARGAAEAGDVVLDAAVAEASRAASGIPSGEVPSPRG